MHSLCRHWRCCCCSRPAAPQCRLLPVPRFALAATLPDTAAPSPSCAPLSNHIWYVSPPLFPLSVVQVAPGVKVALAATLPDTQSGKLLVDYVNKQIHIKSSVGLTTQPKVSLSAASGYKNLVFGAEAAYDTAKSVVSNYGLALGLHAGDSQLAVHLHVSGDRGVNLALRAREEGGRAGWGGGAGMWRGKREGVWEGGWRWGGRGGENGEEGGVVVSNFGLALGLHVGDSQLALH